MRVVVADCAIDLAQQADLGKVPAGTRQFRIGTAVAGVVALAGSFVGFIKLVGLVYPIYGYIGFVLMALGLIGWIRMTRKSGAMASASLR